MDEETKYSRLSDIMQSIEKGAEEIYQDIYEKRYNKLLEYLDVASRFIILDKDRTVLNSASNIMLIYLHAPKAKSIKIISPNSEPHENHMHLLRPNSLEVVCAKTYKWPPKPLPGRNVIEKGLRDATIGIESLMLRLVLEAKSEGEPERTFGSDMVQMAYASFEEELNLKYVADALVMLNDKDNIERNGTFLSNEVDLEEWHIMAGDYMQHKVSRAFFLKDSYERSLAEIFAEKERNNLFNHISKSPNNGEYAGSAIEGTWGCSRFGNETNKATFQKVFAVGI